MKSGRKTAERVTPDSAMTFIRESLLFSLLSEKPDGRPPYTRGREDSPSLEIQSLENGKADTVLHSEYPVHCLPLLDPDWLRWVLKMPRDTLFTSHSLSRR